MPASRSVWISAVAAIILGSTVLGGCVYVPKTTTTYDEKCRFYKRHMTLEVQQVGVIAGCAGDACIAALTLFGAASAATAIVSGSVVVVGNVVYWLEKQGRCMEKSDPGADPR